MTTSSCYWTATAVAVAASGCVVEAPKTHTPGFKLSDAERMKKFDEHQYGICVTCDSGLDDRADFMCDPRLPGGFALMCNACVGYFNQNGYVSCGYGPFSNAVFR